MASSIHFLDVKGKTLLSRDYKGDIPASAIERFPLLLIENENQMTTDESQVSPVISDGGVHYCFISHNNLFIVALAKQNVNVFSVMIFLDGMVKVLTNYFKSLEEESIRDNFVVIYELLDEMMDFGIAQVTDPKMLKEYITQESRILNKTLFGSALKKPPVALTNSISWRSEGITYKKNEAFLDVIESINMEIRPNGAILRSEIVGKIKVNSHLSGMPDLKLGLNEKFLNSGIERATNTSNTTSTGIELEDVKFHQCVRLSKFENEKLITFIPPDGEFELMSYRILSPPLKPLFLVDYKIQNHSNTRLEIYVKLVTNFKKKLTASKLEVTIPCPEDIDSPKFHYDKGSAKYRPEKNAIVWKFKSIPGGKEYAMVAELQLPTVQREDETFKKQPLQVSFQIPYFTTSGLQVRYLKIQEPKLQYQSYPWVRYLTQSGDNYVVRV